MPADGKNDHDIESDPAKAWEIIEDVDICMLVTHGPQSLRARPMSTVAKRDEGRVYLLTEPDSSAADDARRNGEVLLAFQGSGDHLSLSGRVEVLDDKALVRRLWSPGAQVFWPDGPDATPIVVLAVDPGKADYWEGKGMLRSVASMVKGLVTKSEPDLGDRGVVKL